MSRPSEYTIYQLFARCQSEQASESDWEKLNELLDSCPENTKTLEELHQIWSKNYFAENDNELVSQKEAGEEIWEKTIGRAGSRKKGTFNRNLFLKLAAVFVVFCTVAFVLFYIVELGPEVAPVSKTITKQTLPGQKSMITLRDGSVVWLNSDSKIIYSDIFNDSIRLVELEGQAYFEIFEDKTKPFIVKCRNLKVEALGTSFDVDSYEDHSIQVSLVSGSVRLSMPFHHTEEAIVLIPGEFSIVNNDNNIIGYGKFNPYEVLAWKEGRLIFKNSTLDDIIPKLERWYGVIIDNQLTNNPDKPFTSTFEGENLENILLNMGDVLKFDYIIEGNNVKIKNRLPM